MVPSLPRVPDLGDTSPDRTWKTLKSVEEDAVDYNAGEHCQQVPGDNPVGFSDEQNQREKVDQVICNNVRCSDMPLSVDEETMVKAQSKSSACQAVDQGVHGVEVK